MTMEAPPAQPRRQPSSPDRQKREQTVKQFAEYLGTKCDARKSRYGLKKLLADAVAEDEVVLQLPSLDMRLSEEEGQALPKIGEKKTSVSSFEEIEERPDMVASVLTAATNDAAKVEQTAAKNMSKQTSWTRSTVVYASQAVATNVSDFFANLIDSRLKSWTLLLLRHSLSTGDTESRSRLLNVLSASMKVASTETNFKTLPMPPSEGHIAEADVILPLLFEVIVNLSAQGKTETITLRAPGTISGT